MLPGIGVFGSGRIIKILVPILRENGFKIEAIWNRTLQEAQETAKELNIPFFTTKIDDVLLKKDVDLIFVLCSPSLHAQISVKALGIGKHVVCDKPAGLSQEDALKMVRAGQYYPTLISIINHPYRFLPAFIKMKEAIDDGGYIGKGIKLIDVRIKSDKLIFGNSGYDWRCDDIMGGGALNLVGSHVIDLITFLTGERAIKVHGIIRTFTKTTDNINGIRQISAPDFCMFQIELTNDILLTATINSQLDGSDFYQEVVISGDEGHLVVEGQNLYGKRNERGKVCLYKEEEEEEVVAFDSKTLPIPYTKGMCKMVEALREAFLPVNEKAGWIKEPVRFAAGFEDGLYVQAVLSAIRESSQTRQWIKVNVITEQPDTNALLSAAVRRTAISTTS